MMMKKPVHSTDTPVERLSGSMERVTFHSEASGSILVDIIDSSAVPTVGLTDLPSGCESSGNI